ncbi:HHR139Wp [Eremothecium sinecaudum]|uniref:HHR139Wp n=1 Tax=Eremothecium sinecaudum TaxID=45286 RepID=A0A109V149_9SACH|nr:HHR139Wp [Eremothecium sinecaudum]AMD22908.1 HHR139Wp [Eremothecium sinecaudum]
MTYNTLSYQEYMNLLHYPERWGGSVPRDISRKVICNALSPSISVQSTPTLDAHLKEALDIDSMYNLIRCFGDYIQDRDQLDDKSSEKLQHNFGKQRHNSLLLRSSSLYIRFLKSPEEILEPGSRNVMDLQNLEDYLKVYLKKIEKISTNDSPSQLIKHSIFHNFLTLLSSSAPSPYNAFNHPILNIMALDVTKGETYDVARELLVDFKNLPNSIKKFPPYINTSDILPVFVLCFDQSVPEQWEAVQSLMKSIKKHLFVESVPLPLFTQFDDKKIVLHSPIASSRQTEEYDNLYPSGLTFSAELVKVIYDTINSLVEDLMIPFMQRKISFWTETILQPRKSIFHGNKFLKRFMSKSGSVPNVAAPVSPEGYFLVSSNEFLMRKMADWCFMLADYKTSYSIYEMLIKDFEGYPFYILSCQDFAALSLLMGAHTIVTAKMIKHDIDPLIMSYLDTYVEGHEPLEFVRCMLYMTELFLSLSDTWVSSPYAIKYLEVLLQGDRLKSTPLSRTLIWERISFAYGLRIDPRIHLEEESATESDQPGDIEEYPNPEKLQYSSLQNQGYTRFRKQAVFQLLVAKKWLQNGQVRQSAWALKGCNKAYQNLAFANQDGTLLTKLIDAIVDDEKNGDRGVHTADV